jgi:hypothetical protein
MRPDLQDLHPDVAADVILKDAIEDGAITTSDEWDVQESIIDPELLEQVSEEFSESGADNTQGFQNAGISPLSLHYREHWYGRQVHPEAAAPFQEWSIELTRFYVPEGQVGVIKAIEMYLAHQELLADPSFVYTQQSRWGIPGPWHTGNANELPDVGTWHFRAQNLDRTVAQWNVLGPNARALPSISYLDHPMDNGLFFPAGSPSSQNVHLIVPANTMIRLIWHQAARAAGARVEVAAKLRGYIQSDRSTESQLNVRTNW